MSLRSFWLLPLSALLLGCPPKIGNKCSISTDCSQLGDRLCDTNQPEGYCTIFNCEPDNCPDSVCVGFDPSLDPACQSVDDGRWPRFQRSFCMKACSASGDCRDGYECVDLSDPSNRTTRRAEVVDLGAGDGGLGYGVCMAATCGDAIQNGTETDVDCGGPACKPCKSGRGCTVATDCQDGSCVKNVCQGACTDGVRNEAETDVDCGSSACPQCAIGRACKVAADCASGNCADGLCAEASIPAVCKPVVSDGGVPWPPYTGQDGGAGAGGAGGSVP